MLWVQASKYSGALPPLHTQLPLIPEGVPPPASPLKPVLTLQLPLSSPCPSLLTLQP